SRADRLSGWTNRAEALCDGLKPAERTDSLKAPSSLEPQLDSALRPPPDFQLYLISDRRLIVPRDLARVCDEVLGALARDSSAIRVALQLREKDLGGRELYQLAAALRPICTRHGAYLVMNDRIDVALPAEADGVHLPADSIAIDDARRLLGPSRFVGISTHSAAEAAH